MSSSRAYDPAVNTVLNNRYQKTISLLQKHVDPGSTLLDIGAPNPLSEHMVKLGYHVSNTNGDLDESPEIANKPADAATAFEVLEHLVSPMPLLRSIQAKTLVATVPLRLWFAPAYRKIEDPWDWHYHEFEDWQFDWLLEKAGWEVVHREKWTSPTGWLGFRPILRSFTPRYYAVVARRSSPEA